MKYLPIPKGDYPKERLYYGFVDDSIVVARIALKIRVISDSASPNWSYRPTPPSPPR